MTKYNVYSSYIEESTPWASWSDEDILHWAQKKELLQRPYNKFPLVSASPYGCNTVEIYMATSTRGWQVNRYKEDLLGSQS